MNKELTNKPSSFSFHSPPPPPHTHTHLCAVDSRRATEQVGAAVANLALNAVVNNVANDERHGAVRPRDQPRVALADRVAVGVRTVAPADAVLALRNGGEPEEF